MKKIITLIVAFLISAIVVGCKDEKKSEEKLTPVSKESPLVIQTEQKREDDKREKKILSKIGIQKDGSKIIIDTNKTKNFLENMAKTLNKEAKKFEEKAQNLDSSDFGIKIDNDKIEIDLKKTKSFLEIISKDLEGVAKEIEKEIEKE